MTDAELTVLCVSKVRKNWQANLKSVQSDVSGSMGPLKVSSNFTGFFEERAFTVAIASKWQRKAHINVLELEALLLAIRHARRSPVMTLQRVYF